MQAALKRRKSARQSIRARERWLGETTVLTRTEDAVDIGCVELLPDTQWSQSLPMDLRL
jgi:hypothetical protein